MAPSIARMVFSLRRKFVRERTEIAADQFAFARRASSTSEQSPIWALTGRAPAGFI